MATANLGRVGFVNKGTYSGATTYKVNDVVTYNTGTYACIQANTGQAPTNTSYWQNWVSDNAVHKTGDETIAGVKTFSDNTIHNGFLDVYNQTLQVRSGADGGKINFKYSTLNAASRSWSILVDADAYGAFKIMKSSTQTGSTDLSMVTIDTLGNVLVTGSGGLGYGTGSGGTVTQLTSKSTAVTLNKPSGRITMHNASLAGGASAIFIANNSTFMQTDTVVCNIYGGVTAFTDYTISAYGQSNGQIVFALKNNTAGALAQAVAFSFAVIKGATA